MPSLRRRSSVAAILMAALATGCGASSESVCEPGEQSDCLCPDGQPSQRICLDEGFFSGCIGCKKDGGVVVPPLDEEDMLRSVDPDPNPDAGPIGDMKPATVCSATTCNGCCDGNTCVVAAMQTDQKCHVGSMSACQACPSGFSCVPNQACAKQTPTCDAASCQNGCCDNGVCLQADPSHCGKAGGACAVCAAGTLCTTGACQNDLDPNELFKIQIVSVEVLPTNSSGGDWDFFSAPDPRVCFSDTFGSQGCSEEVTDPTLPNPALSPQRYVCGYDATTGRIDRGTNAPANDSMGNTLGFYGSELAKGLPFRVFDMDVNYTTETIAQGVMFKITKLQTQYSILPFQQVYALRFKISVY
jgi:hypothetical protein